MEAGISLDRARVPELVLDVLRTLHAAGKQAFLAGGAVRDLARLALQQIEAPAGERWPPDFDVATDALPDQVMKLFTRTIPTGIQHGTVTVLARRTDPPGGKDDEHKVEVTTFRGEGPYLDGRRPSSVSFLGEIEGDLSRRDFTINAMAWDPLAADRAGGAGDLRDPFGGIDDLKRHLLRAVGNAHDRFSEDGLRPMRAVRQASTLRLALEPKTFRAIGETLETFSRVARERVHDELEKLLLRGRPASRGVRLLLRSRLLEQISPALAASANSDRAHWRRMLRAIDFAPAQLAVRLSILLSPLAPGAEAQSALAFCDQLHFPAKIRDRVGLLLRERTLDYRAEWSDGDCRRALARITSAALEDLFAVRRAFASADADKDREEPMIARWLGLLETDPPLSIAQLAIDGKELMRALKIAPGPQLGRLLRELLERVLNDPSLNSASVLLQLASESLRTQSTGNPQP